MKRFFYSFLRCLSALLPAVLFFPSCMSFDELRGSIDGSKQQWHSDDFSGSSPTAEDLGWNIGMVFLTSPGGTLPKKTSYRPGRPRSGTLYVTANPDFAPQPAVYSLKDHIRFEYGLELINKRSKDGASKVNLIYLEAPIQALYTHPLGNGMVVGGVGPYLAYGLAGKTKFASDKVSSFSKDDGFKRPDAGIIASAGYKINDSFSFRLAYEWGMLNLARDGGDWKVKNRSFSLNVGYPIRKLFGK